MQKTKGKTPLTVQKASGEFDIFDETKLRSSLRRSGASEAIIDQVMIKIQDKIYPNINTKVLYNIAYKVLKRLNRPIAARYSLKKAMMQLGPSGFPFERFFAEILKSQGYSTIVGDVLNGQCITHEVDVLAKKKDEVVLVECKYHSIQGKVSDVKVPLYIHSRFRDIASVDAFQKKIIGRKIKWIIATNTRFSDDAMSYARCAGLDLVAWSYPHGKGLRDLVDSSGLHPITCLSTLTKANKVYLLEKGIVLCKQLQDNLHFLDTMHISQARQKSILMELEGLYN